MSRNPFSSREIEQLVIYIAKYNPVPAGRLGNNLYKSLVDDPTRRPWAKGHTWQSWREYYKKNQDELDRKIRKYQKEQTQKAQEGPQPTHMNHARGESEAQRPPPKVSYTNQTRNAQAGNNGQDNATKYTSRENAQQVASGRVEAPKQKPRVEPERMERSGDANVSSENAIAGKYMVNVSNTSKGNVKHGVEAQASKELPVKAEERTPPDELAPVINTLVEVVDMTGDAESDSDLMRELFGSFKEDEDMQEIDELDPSQPSVPAKVARSKPKNRTAKKPLVVQPAEPSVHAPSPEPALPEPRAEAQPASVLPDSSTRIDPLRKPKPVRKLREPVDHDPFETATSTPTPPPRPRKMLGTRGTLPVLVDDGFRKTLKRPRRSSTTGNEDPHVWPPKRSKRDSGNVQDDDMDIDDAEPEKAKTVALLATRIYAPPSRIQTSTVSRPVQVNAVASSSTSRLPPPLSPKSSKNIQQTKEFVADQTIPSKHPSYQARKSASHNDLAVQQVVQPVKSAVLPAAAIPISRTSSTFTLPTGALSDTDPFMGKASDKAKGKARAFTVLNNDPPLRIDLHKQLQRRLTATSGSISASRSGRGSLAPSASSARNSHEKDLDRQSPAQWQTLTDDPKFHDAEFLEAARQATVRGLAQIAATRGLELEQVRSIFMAAGNLEDTDFVLQQLHARRLQGRSSAAAGRGKPEGSSGASSEEIPDGLILRGAAGPSAAESSRESTHRRRSNKSRRSGRPSLVIRRLPPAEDEYDLSEYSPPNKSRAGQFARLEKQGRLEEALEREKRRVSGIHVEQTQQTPLPLRQTSPTLTASDDSPSPKSRREDEQMEIDANPGGSDDEHVEVVEQDEFVELDEADVYEGDKEPDDIDIGEDVGELDDAVELDDAGVHEDAYEQDDLDEPDDSDRQVESDQQYDSGDEDEGVQQDDVEERIIADQLSDEAAAPSDAEQDDAIGAEGVDDQDNDDADADDIYMPEQGANHEADDESSVGRPEEEDDGAPGSSPPYPTSRTLMNRLSGGRENEPQFISDMQEHRRLALSVTKENAGEMRAFEASHDPDILKLWSIKWARELMAIGRPGDQLTAARYHT